MKVFKKFFSLCLIALVLSSCDENVSKVEEAAKQFIEGVIAKDKVTIYEMYPNTRVYSNLLLPDSIKVDGIKVEFDKTDSVYIVKLNEKQSLICRVDSSEVKICDSYNVLKLDSLSYDLAAKTGYPVKQLSDMTAGKTFGDEGDFIAYLEEMLPSAANGNLYQENGRYSWTGGWYPSVQFDFPVTNMGKNEVKGEDYNMECVFYNRETNERIGTSIANGLDLAPGETKIFTLFKNELFNVAKNYGIYCNPVFNFKNASKAMLLDRYGSFTGKEYEEFVAQQKKGEKEETEKPEANDR